jgi:hypothetical protein
MEEILEAIEARDRTAFQDALQKILRRANLTKGELLRILDVVPSIVNTFQEQFVVQSRAGDITWYRYELVIWEIGEFLRQVLKRNKTLRKEGELFSAIEQAALDPVYGKGRESFVMLLGQYGSPDRVDTLKQLLKDQQVQGHAIFALRLLGAAEVQDDVRPFLQSSKTWIRNEAKKYFIKIQKQTVSTNNAPNPAPPDRL